MRIDLMLMTHFSTDQSKHETPPKMYSISEISISILSYHEIRFEFERVSFRIFCHRWKKRSLPSSGSSFCISVSERKSKNRFSVPLSPRGTPVSNLPLRYAGVCFYRYQKSFIVYSARFHHAYLLYSALSRVLQPSHLLPMESLFLFRFQWIRFWA